MASGIPDKYGASSEVADSVTTDGVAVIAAAGLVTSQHLVAAATAGGGVAAVHRVTGAVEDAAEVTAKTDHHRQSSSV